MAIRLKIFVFVILLSLIVSIPTFVYARDEIDNDDLRNLGGNIKEQERNFKTRHDYKLTFKRPYYYNHTVPFFDTYGRKSLALLENLFYVGGYFINILIKNFRIIRKC